MYFCPFQETSDNYCSTLTQYYLLFDEVLCLKDKTIHAMHPLPTARKYFTANLVIKQKSLQNDVY